MDNGQWASMRCPWRETKARTNGDASGSDRTNGNEMMARLD